MASMDHISDKELLDRQLRMIPRSARVARYHSEPVLRLQSVGEHTYGVIWLILVMHHGAIPSKELMAAALMHDMHEYVTGDVPAPTKRQPGVKAIFDAMESAVETAVGVVFPDLTPEEEWMLKMADSLEGLSFCAFELRQGNREIFACFRNYINYTLQHLAAAPTKSASEVAWKIANKYVDEFNRAFQGADDGK